MTANKKTSRKQKDSKRRAGKKATPIKHASGKKNLAVKRKPAKKKAAAKSKTAIRKAVKSKAAPKKVAVKTKVTAKKKVAVKTKPAKKKAAAKSKTAIRKVVKSKAAPKKAAVKTKATVKKKLGPGRARAVSTLPPDESPMLDTTEFPAAGIVGHSGAQSGDLQGLSGGASADSESVDELLEEGNAFEAGVVMGVEDVGDADLEEVQTHQVPEDDVPAEYLDND